MLYEYREYDSPNIKNLVQSPNITEKVNNKSVLDNIVVLILVILIIYVIYDYII